MQAGDLVWEEVVSELFGVDGGVVEDFVPVLSSLER